MEINRKLVSTSIVSLPSCTALSNRGRIVSNPGNPGGGFVDDFSCTVCGALNKRLKCNQRIDISNRNIRIIK